MASDNQSRKKIWLQSLLLSIFKFIRKALSHSSHCVIYYVCNFFFFLRSFCFALFSHLFPITFHLLSEWHLLLCDPFESQTSWKQHLNGANKFKRSRRRQQNDWPINRTDWLLSQWQSFNLRILIDLQQKPNNCLSRSFEICFMTMHTSHSTKSKEGKG